MLSPTVVGGVLILFLSPQFYGTNARPSLPNAIGDQIVQTNPPSDVPSFVKWPLNLTYPECSRLFDNADGYAEVAGKNRVTHSDSESDLQIPRTCEYYRSRGYYPEQPLSDEEAAFPIAFANTVFQDFDLLERIFSVMYAPQNFYCYVIDTKASTQFKARFLEWAACFPNVIVPPARLSITSSGHNVTKAQMACMRALDAFDWEYLILLQNHDIPLRTNAELVRILRLFNGTNDVSTLDITPTSVDPKASWYFDELGLFRNESMNRRYFDDGRVDGRLYLTKSLVSVSLSRAMIDFILHDLDVTGFMDQLESWYFGIDENFMSTLNSNDLLGVPGGFTRTCLLRGFLVPSITRYAVWNHHAENCYSGRFRHSVCVFGVEDLRYLVKRNELFANKMMSDFDYGAAMCWLEAIYNRTYHSRGGFDEEPDFNASYFHSLNEAYYTTLPHVRFNKMRKEANGGSIALSRDDSFYKILRHSQGLDVEDDSAGWHIMRSLYETTDDYMGSKMMFSSPYLEDINNENDGGFDYFSFNCTHPYRDYYF